MSFLSCELRCYKVCISADIEQQSPDDSPAMAPCSTGTPHYTPYILFARILDALCDKPGTHAELIFGTTYFRQESDNLTAAK